VEAVDPADPLAAFFNTSSPKMRPTAGHFPGMMTGAGSGFIASADGLIVTTAHVIDHARDVTVTMTDHRAYNAKVLSVDTASDVAILKIGATNLPVVRLGDASRVRVGELVLAIGTTAAGDNVITAGIVSAAPTTLADGKRFAFFQTEVATNPDNSGGPLFNRAGEVIGIGVQMHPDVERNSGMTFAIPVDAASALLKTLQSRQEDVQAPSAQLDQYQVAVAQRIEKSSPSEVLDGNPQAMLRSVVVLSFVVDRDGHVIESSVYRTNGDSDAESIALATLRRSSPLPQPPAQLLDGRGRLELFEDWLFNDNRKFHMRELTPPQAQTLN
jgi:TonB family protein